MIERHRRTGCLTRFRTPGADSAFFPAPVHCFSFTAVLPLPLPAAIYCRTCSASAVLPWAYNHLGDSGSILDGGKIRTETLHIYPRIIYVLQVCLF